MKTTGQQGILSRVPLSYMGWLTVGSLVGIGIGFWVLLMTIGVTVLPIVILAVVSIVMAALVFTGVRWMPELAAVYGVGMLIGGHAYPLDSLLSSTPTPQRGPSL